MFVPEQAANDLVLRHVQIAEPPAADCRNTKDSHVRRNCIKQAAPLRSVLQFLQPIHRCIRSHARLPRQKAVQLPLWHSTNSMPCAATISVTLDRRICTAGDVLFITAASMVQAPSEDSMQNVRTVHARNLKHQTLSNVTQQAYLRR